MRKFITILTIIFSLSASAKLTQFIIRGYVEKQDYSKSSWYRESLDSVYVALVQNDTIPIDFKMLTGDDDLKMTTSYELRLLVKGGVGDYSLILNRDGYEPLRHDFKVVSEGQDVVYLRSLPMEARRENTLNEVEVLGTAIKMVMKGDTIVYDSRAFKLAEGSTLDALVRQLPGAQLADDGSITVNGKKVSSLLLNGNDFFQGDPEIALKNLPAYTVDKIKVYDKADKNDNVTLASHSLTSSPEEENIVMDVQLKKEFQMATIFNIEGGYGPGIYPKDNPKKFDHRYLGRAFAIGFGKNYRFSVFGSYNNINNFSKATSNNKDWGYSWNSNSGDSKVAIGGLDVFFNPSKKLELAAEMTYTRTDNYNQQLNSATSFYETGNLYQRSRMESSSLSDEIRASALINYMGDQLSVRFTPRINWLRNRSQSYSMTANFNRNPYESYRGAAIDSLFNRRGAPQAPSFINDVTTSTYQASNNDPGSDRLNLNGWLNIDWRPKKGRGLFNLSANVDDSNSRGLGGTLYDQPYIADPNVNPIRKQQWSDDKNRNTTFGVNICYRWDKKFIGEKNIQTFNLYPAVGHDMARTFRNNIITAMHLLEGIDPASKPLPSVTAPENIRPLLRPDADNTLKTLDLSNEIMGRLDVGYTIEPVAPGDSTFNPRFNIHARYLHRQYWRHYTYDKPYLQPEFHYAINRCEPTNHFNADLQLSSNNKVDYFSINSNYAFSTSLLSLSALVPSMSNADPLNVFLGPENGAAFPTPRNHQFTIGGSYYGNISHRFTNFYVRYNRYDNQLAQSAVFDPATGITTHRPVAVNGNWSTYTYAYCHIPFGPQECWNIGINANHSHNNSVDYVSSVGAPMRSVVKTDDLSGGVRIGYKLKNGTNFVLGGSTTWQHSVSPRVDFRTITAWRSILNAGIEFYLPWQIEGETTLIGNFRRGYEDSALNTTEWIWNASVQKSILKGALTFKLQAVDILGQLSNIYYSVNAQGRTESWSNSLPRYAMLTIAYKFNYTPNSLK